MHKTPESVKEDRGGGLSRPKTILASIATFSTLSLLPKLLALAKDALVAYYFGVGLVLDVYLMAMALIGMPVMIIVGTLQATLVPALMSKDADHSARLLGSAIKFAMLALLLALPLWLVMLPHVMHVLYPNAVNSIQPSLHSAFNWLIPYYFISGINLLLYSALQARKLFWPNAIFPSAFPFAIMAAVWVSQNDGIHALLVGTVIGVVIECSLLLVMLISRGAMKLNKTSGSGLRSVLHLSLPLMVGGAISSMTPIMEQMIAFGLGPGSVALLSYGNKVPAALSTLLITAIGIVILPHYVELIVSKKWRECRTLFINLSISMMFFGLAIAAVGAAFAESIIRILFERGAFTAADGEIAAAVMGAYLFQLPAQIVAMSSLRALMAMGKTFAMTMVGVLQVLFASGLGYLFGKFFGVPGVALGSVAAIWIGTSLLVWVVWNGFKEMEILK